MMMSGSRAEREKWRREGKREREMMKIADEESRLWLRRECAQRELLTITRSHAPPFPQHNNRQDPVKRGIIISG